MHVKEGLECRSGGIRCVIDGAECLRVSREVARLFGKEVADGALKNFAIMVCSDAFVETYALSKEVARVVEVLFSSGYIPYSAGMYLGRLRKARPVFIPSTQLLELLYSTHGLARAFMIGESGVRPFLYGKDVLGVSLLKCFPPIEPGEVVGIVGRDGSIYGLGLSTVGSCEEAYRLRGSRRVIARNIFDVGWYIRGISLGERKYKV